MKRRILDCLMLVAIVLLVALPAAYVTAYFWLSELGMPPRVKTKSTPDVQRCYPSSDLADLFRPGAVVEGAVLGKRVVTGPPNRDFP